MNLNFNPRFEQFDLTEGGEDFDLVERLESELPVLPRKYSNADTEMPQALTEPLSTANCRCSRELKRGRSD